MFSGKVALVTGGGSGIGRATCMALARDGANVVIVDMKEDKAKETMKQLPGNSHSYYAVDVNDKQSLESAVQDVIQSYKAPPTIVVNSAGCYIKSFPLVIKTEEFDKTYNTNVKGTLNVIQVTCSKIIEHKLCGSVINIGSVSWSMNMPPDFAAYAASKAAVHSLTKAVSNEMGQYGVRCNVVHPGLIETPLSLASTTEKFRRDFSSSTALRRIGQPQEVAEVVVFLASEKSSYVTGTSIDVCGGL